MKISEATTSRIIKLMEEKGVSKKDLIKRSGITSETISKILSNYNAKPKITTIYKICKAFEISLAEFYNDTMFNTVAD